MHLMNVSYRVCESEYQMLLATHPPYFWQAVFQELHAQVASPLLCPHQILAMSVPYIKIVLCHMRQCMQNICCVRMHLRHTAYVCTPLI
jgi:hypothetical protein